jgi:UDP-N-acetylmuramyl pentapeptide phosphotransferase/UDP-N-acetylglucosamine-1-phosphate transferase
MIGSILGFFKFNFPKGSIFMGDCGAYWIGFNIAALSILLVERNTNVSPIYALLVNAYPAVETIFTIFRRKLSGDNAVKSDFLHLHSLTYRYSNNRLLTKNNNRKLKNDDKINPAKYLWIFSLLSVTTSAVFWNNHQALIISLIIYCNIYLIIYKLYLIKLKSITLKGS